MPATDDFAAFSTSLESPIQHATAVVPSDTADLPHVTRALYLGAAGDVAVTLKGGAVVTFVGMGAGWHPLRVVRVMATGTTASDILGCW